MGLSFKRPESMSQERYNEIMAAQTAISAQAASSINYSQTPSTSYGKIPGREANPGHHLDFIQRVIAKMASLNNNQINVPGVGNFRGDQMSIIKAVQINLNGKSNSELNRLAGSLEAIARKGGIIN